ncbi:MAG: type VII toxin-antitoxin system MntA family adenylyltransferase antitoxin [Desulfonatronovibrionaceae bacterium]
MLGKDEVDIIIRILERNPRIMAAYLLGSAASGKMREDSDVDLAVLVPDNESLSGMERIELASEIVIATGRIVDIGEIGPDNLVYAKEAVLGGKRIFIRKGAEAEMKIARILGMYIMFNESRQEVIHAYQSG